MKSLFIYFLFVYIGGYELQKLSNLEILDLQDNSFNNSVLSFVEGLPYRSSHRTLSWERITCNSSTGRVTELYLGRVRNQELGDWYLNASLFLPFQQLNGLYLWRLVGLRTKVCSLKYYKIFRLVLFF